MMFRAPTAHQLFFTSGYSAEERARLEQEFFTSLRMPNGTYKTTYHRRFGDLNDLVDRHLPSKRPLEIMDVAVSSGVSTVEWAIHLREAGIEHHMVAGDLLVDAFLIEVTKRFRVLVDRVGRLLQVDVGGSGVCLPPALRYYNNFGRVWAFVRDLAPLVAGLAVAAITGPAIRSTPGRPGKTVGLSYRPLKLVSEALSSLPDVRVVEDDILTNTLEKGRFDVLRAANILNKTYFEERTLERMVTNLGLRLHRGGLMIVCRTDLGDVNNASLFHLATDGKFRLAARLNAGSEIEELVLGLPPLP